MNTCNCIARTLLFLLHTLVAALLLVPAYAASEKPFDFNQLTDEDQAALHKIIREYLVQNPEVLVEALQVLQDREQLSQEAASREAINRLSGQLLDDGYSWVGGNLEGDITIVEFFDYRCGYCRRSHDVVAELIKTDGNIRLVLKEFPILGEESVFAAVLAITALRMAGPEAYKAVHDMLMTYQGPYDTNLVAQTAATAGIEFAELSNAMSDQSAATLVQANYALARELSITGTPAFVIGSRLIRGYLDLDEMRRTVADERARSN